MNPPKILHCPYCYSVSSLIFAAIDINNRVDAKFFDYARCNSCGLVFIKEIPADLGRYYASDYAPYQRPNSKSQLQHFSYGVQPRLQIIKQHISSGKMLEIGPSFGAFSYLAQKSGFEVDVIEMDKDCCDFMKYELGLKVFESNDVEETLTSLGQYDIIILWHNIEHLAAPWRVLEELSKHLNPKGIIAFSTPNPESLQFKLLGKWWHHLDAPRHLHLMPRRFFQSILGKCGLTEVEFSTSDIENANLTKYGWSASFKKLAGDQKKTLKYLCAQIIGKIFYLVFHVFEKKNCAASFIAVYRNDCKKM
ncbi:MAG: class I SAM-dependent methyltransferase [Oligoflexales bacterium]|nr:class I SAM-dependent methyltransferase [Oligoflexales bacterium]